PKPLTPARGGDSLQEGSTVAFTDKPLVCRECGSSFLFTAGEQEVYAQKGFTNEPGRCPEGRPARRAAGGPGWGGLEPRGGRGGRRERQETRCASWGGRARVPFVPRGDKPVYCSSCFEQQRSYR